MRKGTGIEDREMGNGLGRDLRGRISTSVLSGGQGPKGQKLVGVGMVQTILGVIMVCGL